MRGSEGRQAQRDLLGPVSLTAGHAAGTTGPLHTRPRAGTLRVHTSAEIAAAGRNCRAFWCPFRDTHRLAQLPGSPGASASAYQCTCSSLRQQHIRFSRRELGLETELSGWGEGEDAGGNNGGPVKRAWDDDERVDAAVRLHGARGLEVARAREERAAEPRRASDLLRVLARLAHEEQARRLGLRAAHACRALRGEESGPGESETENRVSHWVRRRAHGALRDGSSVPSKIYQRDSWPHTFGRAAEITMPGTRTSLDTSPDCECGYRRRRVSCSASRGVRKSRNSQYAALARAVGGTARWRLCRQSSRQARTARVRKRRSSPMDDSSTCTDGRSGSSPFCFSARIERMTSAAAFSSWRECGERASAGALRCLPPSQESWPV